MSASSPPTAGDSPKFTILLPTYNERENIDELIQAIFALEQSYAGVSVLDWWGNTPALRLLNWTPHSRGELSAGAKTMLAESAAASGDSVVALVHRGEQLAPVAFDIAKTLKSTYEAWINEDYDFINLMVI